MPTSRGNVSMLKHSSAGSSTSSTSSRKQTAPPGFRIPPKPTPSLVAQMSAHELHERYTTNNRILASLGPSTSTYYERVLAEQAAVESRLIDLEGMDHINTRLKNTKIEEEEDMIVDTPSEVRTPGPIEAKKKALALYGQSIPIGSRGGSMSMQEAMELERQAFLRDKEREQRRLEKKARQGIPVNGEVLTRQEREARIWAFMNHKPTDSDLEDDSDYDSDDDDPSTWFDDDQNDGRKGQPIVEPDEEDYSDIIRVDDNKIRYSTFYEPHDDGD